MRFQINERIVIDGECIKKYPSFTEEDYEKLGLAKRDLDKLQERFEANVEPEENVRRIGPKHLRIEHSLPGIKEIFSGFEIEKCKNSH